MKRVQINLLMYLVTASMIMISSCNGNKETDKLTVTPTAISFSATNPVVITVTVDTNVKDWNPVTSDNWIFISKSEEKFTVMVTEYTGTGDREGTIVVKAGKAEETIKVTQTARLDITLTLNPSSITFAENETGTKPVVVTPISANWEFSCSANWLILSKTGSTLNVTVNDLYFGNEARTATVTVTAGNAAPVNLEVNQEPSKATVVEFDAADGFYYGNYFDTGTANFELYFFDISEEQEYEIFIDGFSTLPTSESEIANFKLDVGTYSFEETGNKRTWINIMVFNNTTDKLLFATQGTFTVALSNDIYTISSTNLSGFMDAETGASVAGAISMTFTGPIDFEDMTYKLSDFSLSQYTATGSPQLSFNGGVLNETEWNGEVVPNDDEFGQYIAITNFAESGITIFADIIDGKLILDTENPVYYDSEYEFYLELLLYYDGGFYFNPSWWDGSIQFDKINGIIDFSKSFTFSDIGRQDLVVGIFAYSIDGNDGGWVTNVYPDIKLELTPITQEGTSKSRVRENITEKRSSCYSSKKHSTVNKDIKLDNSKLIHDHHHKFDKTTKFAPNNNLLKRYERIK